MSIYRSYDVRNTNWIFDALLSSLTTQTGSFSTIQLKIQSLQIIHSMAEHIMFYENHLNDISIALEFSFADTNLDVKLHAAKAFCSVTENLNKYIVSHPNEHEFLEPYYHLWNKNMNILIDEIQNVEYSSTYRSTLCDAFTSIECIYDRFSVSKTDSHLYSIFC